MNEQGKGTYRPAAGDEVRPWSSVMAQRPRRRCASREPLTGARFGHPAARSMHASSDPSSSSSWLLDRQLYAYARQWQRRQPIDESARGLQVCVRTSVLTTDNH
jgi:hypothetical protein